MSKINVNTVDTQCGSTLTLGSSGKTVTLASGASQSGFGRTGTVDWCTTAKTSPFTSVSGKGYFVNTTSGSVTVTLPASPSAGDIVAIKDYANTFDTNSVTLCRNSSKINGVCSNSFLTTESQSVTLVYVDGTKGWQDIHDSTSNVTGTSFISACGGTETTCGNFKIHTFTGDGTFTVSSVSNIASYNDISYVVVAGGAGGGGGAGPSFVGSGAGGAGGFRENKGSQDTYTASPLNGSTPITVTATSFPITVGGGGSAGAYGPSAGSPGGDGSNSVFSTITSAGGGGGGARLAPVVNGRPGGSGGGAGYDPTATTGGTGNTPPVSPAQGNDGGDNPGGAAAGGGGGATVAGGDASPTVNGAGGAGATTSISASPTAYAGGGGAGASDSQTTGGAGGTGGGGAGGPSTGSATAGTTNRGGGGGGASSAANNAGAAGGSGVVILRYRYQ